MVRNPCSSIQSPFSHFRNSLNSVQYFSLYHLWKIMPNCHEVWVDNCICKLQWRLRCDCVRWHVLGLYIICPSRNSYTISFLVCLLLVWILRVHVIIIAWSLWLFSIFIAIRCRELEIYSTTSITAAKKDLAYFLFHFPRSSARAKPAHVTESPQLYVYQRSRVWISSHVLFPYPILKCQKDLNKNIWIWKNIWLEMLYRSQDRHLTCSCHHTPLRSKKLMP